MRGIRLAQFFGDGLDLLPHKIFPLVLGNLLLNLSAQFGFQLQNIHFTSQNLQQLLQPLYWMKLAQNVDFILILHHNVDGDVIRQIAGIIGGLHLQHDVRRHFGSHFHVLPEDFLHCPDQSHGFHRIPRRGFLTGGHVAHHVRMVLKHIRNFRPVIALHQNADAISWLL